MLSILLGFLGYSILNISQATQKIGLILSEKKRRQGILLWLLATFGTLVSSFVVFAAVALGNASLVGAMAGAGLASLAIFSHFVMKEQVGIKEICGVIIIVIAAGIIGFFSKDSPPSLIRLDWLFLMLGIVILLYSILCIIASKKVNLVGLVIGSFSGALGGFVPLFQKVSTSEFGTAWSLFPVTGDGGTSFWGTLLAMFSNPFTLAWILLSIVSMLVLQFAYKKAEVIRILPFFAANCIVVPVFGGVLCLGEELNIMQWIGVIGIMGGLVLLTVKGRRKME